jgi:alpha-D-ribose 1-methylphosphonate 5-triphosphate synthase subunit PhnI
MFVSAKGGETAIENSIRLLAQRRRGDLSVEQVNSSQIVEQLGLAVDRVMAEAALWEPITAAHAIQQARGDLVEAVFLLRAWRTTLPRQAFSKALATENMRLERRISATFKDIPGGQVLGPTFDYTHRLLEEIEEDPSPPSPPEQLHVEDLMRNVPTVACLLEDVDLMQKETPENSGHVPFDITRESIRFPADRDQRLQLLGRGDEGFLLSLAYSVQRGFGGNHPFVGELRVGWVMIEVELEELDLVISLGEVRITECQTVHQFISTSDQPPQFTRGYGLVVGHNERKAIAMAIVDRALRSKELGESIQFPAQDEEFVLAHLDNVQASGFVSHLKLPHHVDFQSELHLLRCLRAAHSAKTYSTSEGTEQ